MATCYGVNRDVGYSNNTMNTDPYKEILKESLDYKDENIRWLKSGAPYEPSRPAIWLQLLGLFETLEIIHNK